MKTTSIRLWIKIQQGEKMFLEVYAVPLNDYNKETGAAIRPENRRLVEMTGVRIRYSTTFEDRAELVLPNKDILIAAGSYEDLVQRLMAGNAVIARA
jgi:hypothetical protein